MTLEERLYEAGVMYEHVRPEVRAKARHEINSCEAAYRDLERRVGRLLRSLERNLMTEDER